MSFDHKNDDGLQSKPGPTELHLETVDADLKAIDGVPIIENRAEKEKAVLRKIDLRMMPLMMVICESPCSSTRYPRSETLKININ